MDDRTGAGDGAVESSAGAASGRASRGAWTRTLDLYIFSRFAAIYAANLVSFTMLFVIIDFVTNVERFGKTSDGLGSLLRSSFRYYVSMVPIIFCQVLGPAICVTSSLFTVTLFQRSGEFVPMLVSGRSYQRTLAPILFGAAVSAVVIFGIQEFWIPQTVEQINEALQARDMKAEYKDVRYLDDKNGLLIVLKKYKRFEQIAEGVLVLPIRVGVEFPFLIHASSMHWVEPVQGQKYWQLRDAYRQEYDARGNLVVRRAADWEEMPGNLEEFLPRFDLQTTMLPQDIELAQEDAVYMDLKDLRRRVADSPDANRWIIKYMARFSTPLANFVLVLLGLPVIVFYGGRNIFVGALLSVAVAVVYFVLHSTFQEFGVRGQVVSARVGAWVAPSLFIALGSTWYRAMRT